MAGIGLGAQLGGIRKGLDYRRQVDQQAEDREYQNDLRDYKLKQKEREEEIANIVQGSKTEEAKQRLLELEEQNYGDIYQAYKLNPRYAVELYNEINANDAVDAADIVEEEDPETGKTILKVVNEKGEPVKDIRTDAPAIYDKSTLDEMFGSREEGEMVTGRKGIQYRVRGDQAKPIRTEEGEPLRAQTEGGSGSIPAILQETNAIYRRLKPAKGETRDDRWLRAYREATTRSSQSVDEAAQKFYQGLVEQMVGDYPTDEDLQQAQERAKEMTEKYREYVRENSDRLGAGTQRKGLPRGGGRSDGGGRSGARGGQKSGDYSHLWR